MAIEQYRTDPSNSFLESALTNAAGYCIHVLNCSPLYPRLSTSHIDLKNNPATVVDSLRTSSFKAVLMQEDESLSLTGTLPEINVKANQASIIGSAIAVKAILKEPYRYKRKTITSLTQLFNTFHYQVKDHEVPSWAGQFSIRLYYANGKYEANQEIVLPLQYNQESQRFAQNNQAVITRKVYSTSYAGLSRQGQYYQGHSKKNLIVYNPKVIEDYVNIFKELYLNRFPNGRLLKRERRKYINIMSELL